MYTIMSEEEVRKREERVKELHDSLDLEDRITAILTDVKIGTTGLHEPTARIKAKALAQLFEVWKQTELKGMSYEPEEQ